MELVALYILWLYYSIALESTALDHHEISIIFYSEKPSLVVTLREVKKSIVFLATHNHLRGPFISLHPLSIKRNSTIASQIL